ncbi:MAG: T9SS type A sorting domain-containing protein [Bacteroidota bacterium]
MKCTFTLRGGRAMSRFFRTLGHFLPIVCLLLIFVTPVDISGQDWTQRNVNFSHPYGDFEDFIKTPDGAIWSAYNPFQPPFGSVLFRSLDNGASWETIVSTPDTSFSGIQNWDFFPVDSTNIWCTFVNSNPANPFLEEVGLYKSADAGRTWSVVPLPKFDTLQVAGDFHFFDSNTGVVFSYSVSKSFTLLRTTDGGMNWDSIETNISPTPIIGTRYKPYLIEHKGDTLWAGTEAGTIIRSTDKGATWTQAAVGTDEPGPVVSIGFKDHLTGFAVKGFLNDNISAITTTFKTTDGGSTWSRVSAPIRMESAQYVPGSGGVWIGEVDQRLGLGYVISKDDGQTWQKTGNPFDLEAYTGITFFSPSEGYSGSVSIEFFNNILPFNNFPGVRLREYTGDPLLFDPNFSDGLQFEPGGEGHLPDGYALAALHAAGELEAWGVSYQPSLMGPLADTAKFYIAKTLNGGNNWGIHEIVMGEGRTGIDVWASNQMEVWITTTDQGNGQGSALMKSNDGGSSWNDIYTGPGASGKIHFFDARDGIIIDGINVSRTTDGGVTWMQVPSSSIPMLDTGETIYTGANTQNLAVKGDNLWMGTTNGKVLKSADRGQTWTLATVSAGNGIYGVAFQDEMNGLAISPYFFNPGPPHVPVGIYRTTDGGATWTDLQNEVLLFDMRNLTHIPGTENSYLMTSTLGEGLGMYTTDGGDTWQNLPDMGAFGVVEFSDYNQGWMSRGAGMVDTLYPMVYKYKGDLFDQFVGIGDAFTPLEAIRAYPNPATHEVNLIIPDQLMGKNLTVRMMDLQGRTLLTQSLNTAPKRLTLPLDGIATGVYHLLLEGEGISKRAAIIKR